MLTRPAAVAGSFYPADAKELHAQIQQLLGNAKNPPIPNTPKALIVPHAGYIYSGATAAAAYNTLVDSKDAITRVVLVGPSHRVATRHIATTSANYFATPFGDIAVDQDAIQTLVVSRNVVVNDEAHRWEHSLEVQLPFLQHVLTSFAIVPLAVSGDLGDTLHDCIMQFWNDPHTLLAISSDLSHFHPYHEARTRDKNTCERILQRKVGISPEQACGCTAINGLISVLQEQHSSINLLDYRNSGDTAGDKRRVVGYASFAVYTGN